jgi:hypothetical protein
MMQNQPRVKLMGNSPPKEDLKATPLFGSPIAAHRIGILMSQTGRFLECTKCRLYFPFPAGARYDTVASQFEGRLCETATSNADQG